MITTLILTAGVVVEISTIIASRKNILNWTEKETKEDIYLEFAKKGYLFDEYEYANKGDETLLSGLNQACQELQKNPLMKATRIANTILLLVPGINILVSKLIRRKMKLTLCTIVKQYCKPFTEKQNEQFNQIHGKKAKKSFVAKLVAKDMEKRQEERLERKKRQEERLEREKRQEEIESRIRRYEQNRTKFRMDPPTLIEDIYIKNELNENHEKVKVYTKC